MRRWCLNLVIFCLSVFDLTGFQAKFQNPGPVSPRITNSGHLRRTSAFPSFKKKLAMAMGPPRLEIWGYEQSILSWSRQILYIVDIFVVPWQEFPIGLLGKNTKETTAWIRCGSRGVVLKLPPRKINPTRSLTYSQVTVLTWWLRAVHISPTHHFLREAWGFGEPWRIGCVRACLDQDDY
jgi:hypothetical protein